MTAVQVPSIADAATSILPDLKIRATGRRVSNLDITAKQHRNSPSTPELKRSSSIPSLTTRQTRKPSPGLAARLKALGFGKDRTLPSATPPASESIGRIPEDQIRQLDLGHRADLINSQVQRRGRAWSGASSQTLPPQIIGDSSTGFSIGLPTVTSVETSVGYLGGDKGIVELATTGASSVAAAESPLSGLDEDVDMDQMKYRMPEHINGNGTKSIPDIRKAHIARASIVDDYDEPPPPISKEPPVDETQPGGFSTDVQSYFNPFGLQRAGSIYTLSRVSFANQLAQLTSLQLPDAESLSGRVSSIPTSHAASKALMGAAEQIRSWISKASEVLDGLDAEDDVEWAEAGGREGLAEVDNAISRFEELIHVYVSAIEELQSRGDIANVPSEELKTVVIQVESILAEWDKVRNTLTHIKAQVEIAMEWEELWNVVLGDIGNEMDILTRLVFEMEEKRHKSLTVEAGGDDMGIEELETIVEEAPSSSAHSHARNRFSITTAFPMSPHSPYAPATAHDDSSLLALFARMQPLRASLDFLPMRLSSFHGRADEIFPTACAELETRRDGLERSWKRLEKDAESLRRELGEDRWVLVFRGAGRQAQKLYESVERGFSKLKESIDAGSHYNNPSVMGKKIENYESKKMHYGPAIDRVLAIIERGVKDRLTVNGEVLRLHSDMQNKWDALKSQIAELDIQLEDLQAEKKNQQLRDSVSSLMSNDRSTMGSMNETPGSSPASSVILSNLQGGLEDLHTPSRNGKARPTSYIPQSESSRHSTPPTGSSHPPRKGLSGRVSSYGFPGTQFTTHPSTRGGPATPTGNRLSRSGLVGKDDRPRWNSSVKTPDGFVGHNFKPLSLTTPSPHAKSRGNNPERSPLAQTPTPKESKISLRSPLGAADPMISPSSVSTASKTPISTTRLPYRTHISSPGPYSQQAHSSPSIRPRQLQSQASTPNLASRRASLQPRSSGSPSNSPSQPPVGSSGVRSASSMAVSRGTSSLSQPQTGGRPDSSVTGRESPQAIAGAATAMRRGSNRTSIDSKGKEKQKWR